MKYHISRGETRLGIWTPDELAAKYNAGDLLHSDFIWTEGMAEWIPFENWLATPEGREFDAQARSAETPPAPSPTEPPPIRSTSPGTPLPPPAPDKPSNYLVQSILVTLFCCLPLGIVSIVFAAQVDSKYAGGDYSGSQKASANAKLWCWISFGLGLATLLGYAGLGAIGVLAETTYP